jgi:hypothetical protein
LQARQDAGSDDECSPQTQPKVSVRKINGRTTTPHWTTSGIWKLQVSDHAGIWIKYTPVAYHQQARVRASKPSERSTRLFGPHRATTVVDSAPADPDFTTWVARFLVQAVYAVS